jgi:hypothetical protein
MAASGLPLFRRLLPCSVNCKDASIRGVAGNSGDGSGSGVKAGFMHPIAGRHNTTANRIFSHLIFSIIFIFSHEIK